VLKSAQLVSLLKEATRLHYYFENTRNFTVINEADRKAELMHQIVMNRSVIGTLTFTNDV